MVQSVPDIYYDIMHLCSWWTSRGLSLLEKSHVSRTLSEFSLDELVVPSSIPKLCHFTKHKTCCESYVTIDKTRQDII